MITVSPVYSNSFRQEIKELSESWTIEASDTSVPPVFPHLYVSTEQFSSIHEFRS